MLESAQDAVAVLLGLLVLWYLVAPSQRGSTSVEEKQLTVGSTGRHHGRRSPGE
jgi:hypothetical protein